MNPFLPTPERGEVSSGSRTDGQQTREERDVARQEGDPDNTSSTEQRGTTLTATEAVVALPAGQGNDRIGITPATLLMLRSRQIMENQLISNQLLPVADANNGDEFVPPENILGLIPLVDGAEAVAAGMVSVHSEDETVLHNDLKPIEMSNYLDILRKELKEEQGLPLAEVNLEIDDQQLEQDEIALNRAVLDSGMTPEELRVLRALENRAISNSVFGEIHYIALRRRLERDSNTSPHGPYMAQFQVDVARDNARLAAVLTQQAEQETEAAIMAIIEREGGYTAPVTATPVEETPEPLLRRQTYSY